MGIQGFSPRVCLSVEVILLCFACIGSCMRNSNIAEVPNFEKYITFSYFMQHDNFIDPVFQDYLVNNLPHGFCDIMENKSENVPSLSVTRRHLIGEGSHRRLSSSVRFEVVGKSISELPTHFCEAIVIERLPSGIFADPFELHHLFERKFYRDAAAFGDTNLELPSFRSDRSVVEIHMDIGSNVLLQGKNDGLEINIEIPLHARYPPLGETGFSRVEFGPPELFTRCWVEGNSNNRKCLIRSANKIVESNASSVVWDVPCGIKEHATIVSFVTFTSAILSALLIVFTSLYVQIATDFKQS